MTGETVRIVLVGLGGYGETFLRELLDCSTDRDVALVAGVDPAPQRCSRIEALRAKGVSIYESLEAFYSAGGEAELVIVASPIHCHRAQTELALVHGANVLCEKPLCATIQDALAMQAAEQAAPGFVAIGYQWSFSSGIQALKRDVRAGELGQAVQARTLVCWPRNAAYYSRSAWAGALKTREGEWVLDSPVNNAVAHYLHNMFYVLGASRETSAVPCRVQAELYRANAITNYDTGMLRARTTSGVPVLFIASHAIPYTLGPVTHFSFEKADVHVDMERAERVIATFKDGRVKDYGACSDGVSGKIWQCVDSVRSGQPPACGISAAMSQTLCMNGAQESAGEPVAVPDEAKAYADVDETLTTIRGLLPLAVQCDEQAVLPSELGGVPWARPGTPVDLTDYSVFPSNSTNQ